jgi:hypothetical protein
MRTLLFTCLVLATAAGCKHQIDGTKAEAMIRNDLLGAKGIKVATVSCPKDRAAKAGDKFTCAVTLASGEAMTINMEQTDGDGNVNAVVDGLIIDTDKVSATVAEKVGLRAKAKATCDKVAFKNGVVATCELVDGAEKRKVELTVINDAGGFTWKDLSAPVAAAPPAGDPPAAHEGDAPAHEPAADEAHEPK